MTKAEAILRRDHAYRRWQRMVRAEEEAALIGDDVHVVSEQAMADAEFKYRLAELQVAEAKD